MQIGPVAFPGAKQSLGIVVLVLAVLYIVQRVDSVKSFVYPKQ